MTNKKISSPKTNQSSFSQSVKKPAVKKHLDLLYMTRSSVSAGDIATLLENNQDLTIEVWESMNILEIELPNKITIDIEPVDLPFQDPSDAAFAKNRNIVTVFAISLCEEDFDRVKPYFAQIVSAFSGFICADSANFSPVYIGTL